MKKQRSAWLEDSDWRKLNDKIKSEGFKGKGRYERFLEKVARCETLIFLETTGKNVKIILK